MFCNNLNFLTENTPNKTYSTFNSAVKASKRLNSMDYLVDWFDDMWDYVDKTPDWMKQYKDEDWWYDTPGLLEISDWRDIYDYQNEFGDNCKYVVSDFGDIGVTYDNGNTIKWILTIDYADNFDELYFADEDDIDRIMKRGM